MKVYMVQEENGIENREYVTIFLNKENAIEFATQQAKQYYELEEIEQEEPFEDCLFIDTNSRSIWIYDSGAECYVTVYEIETADGKSDNCPLTIH